MTIDNRYAVGAFCTWHDFLSHARVCLATASMLLSARLSSDRGTNASGHLRLLPPGGDDEGCCYLCPRCGCEVTEVALDDWLGSVAAAQRREPGAEHEAMALWSRGRCFPDYDTLINAYRQAHEE